MTTTTKRPAGFPTSLNLWTLADLAKGDRLLGYIDPPSRAAIRKCRKHGLVEVAPCGRRLQITDAGAELVNEEVAGWNANRPRVPLLFV